MASASTSSIKTEERSIEIAYEPELVVNADSKELYEALKHGEKEKVLQLCNKFSDGPFHVITIHNDTVLHMATSTKQVGLVLELLDRVPADQFNKLTLKNKGENTILHEACTSDKLLPAAEQMLIKAPELFNMRNYYEETPLFRSVTFGRVKMFKFLDEKSRELGELGKDAGLFARIKSKTTILHRAVENGSFELALIIAKKYKEFVHKQDERGMTALQLLACDSSAFKSGRGFKAGCWRLPCWEKTKERKKYERAVELAQFLIKEDRSWMETRKVESQHSKTHVYESGDPAAAKSGNVQKAAPTPPSNIAETPNIAGTPLFLAIKTGCVEIVKEILTVYPWAVEHIDGKGRTILHVAIKYRQKEVLDLVMKMGPLVKRLERKIDKDYNTILHMVGEKKKPEDRVGVPEEIKSPAFELRDNLDWDKRAKEICPSSMRSKLNLQKKTAQNLFDDSNEKLRGDAKKWYQHTAEHCSIVAVLIATVAFAAAYTVPGGSEQSTGTPILLHRPFFVVFTLTDVLSLTFSLTSVIFFLRIHTSSFRLKDFKRSLPHTLLLGITLLILSVSMMMFAFAATVILMMNKRELWTKVALYTASFFPVTIFALSYLPLFFSLLKTFDFPLKKVADFFHLKKMADFFHRNTRSPCKSKPKPIETSSSANPQKPRASAGHASV